MRSRSATRRKVLSVLPVGAVAVQPAETAFAQSSGATKDIRYVVFHRPGPAWQQGKSMFEQPGVAQHVQHYRQWLASGKLEFGGPHLDAAGGGMMIPVAGVPQGEVERFAAEDPAVKDGTLLFEVRPWLIGMSM